MLVLFSSFFNLPLRWHFDANHSRYWMWWQLNASVLVYIHLSGSGKLGCCLGMWSCNARVSPGVFNYAAAWIFDLTSCMSAIVTTCCSLTHFPSAKTASIFQLEIHSTGEISENENLVFNGPAKLLCFGTGVPKRPSFQWQEKTIRYPGCVTYTVKPWPSGIYNALLQIPT